MTIRQGKTFAYPIWWEQPVHVYRPITAIARTAPVRITCPSHDVPDEWRFAVVSAKGMTQINAKNNPPADSDYRRAVVVDADTLEINEVNAADFAAYTSGGYVQYFQPVDLTGYQFRLVVKDRKGGTVLLTLTTANGGISVDHAKRQITLNISATDTAAIAWRKGVWEMEAVSGGGEVQTLLEGTVSVETEVAT